VGTCICSFIAWEGINQLAANLTCLCPIIRRRL
jgi:hypothetical protein